MDLFKYPQKTNVKTSLDINEITPVYWNVLYPGDKIENFTYRNITRMITPIYPTLDAPKVELYAFAVPERLLNPVKINWDNPENKPNSIVLDYHKDKGDAFRPIDAFFKNVFSENKQKDAFEEVNIELTNKVVLEKETFVNKTTLHNKFGFKLYENYLDILTSINLKDTLNLNLNYFLAYKKIYFDFFRQKQFEASNYEDVFRNFFLELEKVNTDINHVISDDFKKVLKYLNTINVCNVKNTFLNSLTFNKIDNKLKDLNDWSDFKENIFNNYIKNEKILNNIDYGTQKDILLKVWNRNNDDRTNAKLIGYSDFIQGISQVVNTAQTSSNSLGEIGGLSVTNNNDILIHDFEAVEKTYVMVLAVPRYDLNLIGYTNPDEWFVDTSEKWVDYNPNMELIQKPLYNYSFWGDADDEYHTNIAYYKPFDFLRKKQDVVAGEIMDKWSNWTYSYEIEGDEGIGLSILKASKKPFKDTLVSPAQDSFITEWEFSANFKRSILPEFIVKEKILEGD